MIDTTIPLASFPSPNRRTTHRVVALNLPTPSWMRAPGECPGMYALESALDELAIACELVHGIVTPWHRHWW